MKSVLKNGILWYLVMAMAVIGMVPQAYAGFAPSDTASLPQWGRTADLDKIQKALESKMVQERLEALGFTQEEITARLNQLDNEQIHQLAMNLDRLQVGGGALEFIIGVLVIVILVLVILRLTGHSVIIR